MSKKKIIVVLPGKPPIGSWHQRIKMFNLGFTHHGYDFEHIVPYFPPTHESQEKSPSYIKYCLKPKKRRERSLKSIPCMILGTFRCAYYLLRQKKVEFVLMPGLNLAIGLTVFLVCKIKRIPLYAEIADENGKLFSEEKLNIVDTLAKYNQILYEKLILKKAGKTFVFTSYLENKYNKMFHNGNIIRCTPSMIDLDNFDKLKMKNIEEIQQPNISLLKSSDYLKITYAGACNRTNGIFFFLENLSEVLKEVDFKIQVFFFFVYGNVEKVRNYCKELGIIEIVEFFEPVYPDYIPSIYDNSDILVLPEHGDIIANAGFPGKTSELLASGKAIIATDFSDLSDYLKNEENAMISAIGDKKSYKANLMKLITDKDVRIRIGNNARETALNNFNTVEAVKVYLDEK